MTCGMTVVDGEIVIDRMVVAGIASVVRDPNVVGDVSRLDDGNFIHDAIALAVIRIGSRHHCEAY